MITVYAIKPDNPKLFKAICLAFSYKFKKIDSIKEINTDKEIIILHDKKGENLKDFEHPKEAYYVFGADEGNLIQEIHRFKPEIEDKVKFVRIESYPCCSFHASVACGIVLHDRFMKIN